MPRKTTDQARNTKVPTDSGHLTVFGREILLNVAEAQASLLDAYYAIADLTDEESVTLRSYLASGIQSTGTALAVAGGLKPVE